MSASRLACLASLTVMAAPLVNAQDRPPMLPGDATLLQISAQGESHRTPDIATISAGVVTQDKDAKVAMSDNANRMNAVITALKKAGVADRDLQTSSISLNPQYNYNSGNSNNQPPTITSYQASNTVNVRLRDIGKVGDVLDALVKQGANQINGPTFNVDKPDVAMDEARTEAVKQAQARAALYASATGLKVRRIVSISESGEVAPPQPRMMMARADKEPGTPIAAGESTLAVDLNVVFELGR